MGASLWRPRPSPRRATSQPGHMSWNVGMWSPMSREKTKDTQAPLECPEPYCSATCQPRDFRAGDTLSLEGHKGESLGGRGWLGPSQIGSEMAAEPGVQGQPAGCKRVPVAVPSQFCTPQPGTSAAWPHTEAALPLERAFRQHDAPMFSRLHGGPQPCSRLSAGWTTV